MPETPTVCAPAVSNPKDRKQLRKAQKMARGLRSVVVPFNTTI